MTDPKNINEIMAEFTDENDVLDMEAFLAAASDPEHPGHRFFLWDKADAGNAYRQAQVAVDQQRLRGDRRRRGQLAHGITQEAP